MEGVLTRKNFVIKYKYDLIGGNDDSTLNEDGKDAVQRHQLL
jgi:hypothetical protein